MSKFKLSDWLPTSAKEVKARGWSQLDVILFTGDAYVDHPSFGAAVVGRLLEQQGLRVAIVPQPNWQDDLRDFRKLGVPRLFFGVSAGSMDSMVNHYTANKRLRSNDAYTPGDKSGFRPDYAATVYTKILKSIYPDTPVVLGGIEASLRRLTHYDYWNDRLMPSVLIESGADLIAYGMGDKVMIDIARCISNGYNVGELRKIRQIAFVADREYVDSLVGISNVNGDSVGDSVSRLAGDSTPEGNLASESAGDPIVLNSYEQCCKNGRKFGENFVNIERESNSVNAKTLVEPYADKFVVVNAPYHKLTEQELDNSFALPYTRLPHPRYNGKGDIPAYQMIKHSVNIHRGCFGGCSFCTISAHQGKFISSRSVRSITEEVEKIAEMDDFRGNLSDVGGPSANMYGMGGKNEQLCQKCTRYSCIYPAMCKNLNNNHDSLLALYKSVTAVKGVKKAYVGSGIRYDLFGDNNPRYLSEVVRNHTSGRLKVAPEHTEDKVLKLMRKPSFEMFYKLNDQFLNICAREGLKYQLIPYFISSHPGCNEHDMKELSKKMRGLNFRLEQVQDLTPTPMTLSSVMFFTGEDPFTHEKVYVARSQDDKRKQKSYFFKK